MPDNSVDIRRSKIVALTSTASARRRAWHCCGQLKLPTALEFFQYRFSDSFGGNPPLYSCGLMRQYPNDIVRYGVSCIAETYIAVAGTHSFFRLLKSSSIGLLSQQFPRRLTISA